MKRTQMKNKLNTLDSLTLISLLPAMTEVQIQPLETLNSEADLQKNESLTAHNVSERPKDRMNDQESLSFVSSLLDILVPAVHFKGKSREGGMGDDGEVLLKLGLVSIPRFEFLN